MAERDELAALEDELRGTLDADVRSIAEELEEKGWETHVLEPEAIHVQAPGSDLGQGFEIVVPEPSIEPVFELVTAGEVEFDGSEVYGVREGTSRLLVVVVLASDREIAVVSPLAFGPDGAEVVEGTAEAGQIRTLFRSPDGRTLVITHDDPTIFQPDEDVEGPA